MACQSIVSMACIALLLGALMAFPTSVQPIGVCYGTLANNLPPSSEVVELYKSNNIELMRLYYPIPDALQALRGSNIKLLLDVPNEDLQLLASDPSAASYWVQTNVTAYWPDVSFRYIAVGNEVMRGDKAQYVLPAMQNIYSALSSGGLQDQIKVSTSVSQEVLGLTFPPSHGDFSPVAKQNLEPVVQFLLKNGAPLLVNVYPYFVYIYNKQDITNISYALFTSSWTVVKDGQYSYQNLFDAYMDALYSALEQIGGSAVEIVVSESGWPSAGGDSATIGNAQTYNQNLINHVSKGTPKRPGKAIEAYIFAMFNENQKPAGVEQHWGLFYPNEQPVYPIQFH
ncbi:glucan endo-1,3-beta-glucosidase [Elaeis guineensis]|uniref:Glucan endo-1,3-beta-glucosidase n=1 Tax=Elaeis guineensis var. tenera TaxID=51953 RepID=A0A6I9R958_ELAGV|nr:glucan endo-1,3-beta-glucosidase [Elaeis guineensis]